MITCPACGGIAETVKDSRPSGAYIRRRRECVDCGERLTTYEVPSTVLDALNSERARRVEAATNALRDALVEMKREARPATPNRGAPSRQLTGRNLEITRRRNAGEAASAIGRDYGITGERVRQIVNRTRAQMGLTEGT